MFGFWLVRLPFPMAIAHLAQSEFDPVATKTYASSRKFSERTKPCLF